MRNLHPVIRYYTYNIIPTEEQGVLLDRYMGCARYVYNKGVEMIMKASVHGDKVTSKILESNLPDMRKEHQWLKECPAQILMLSMRDVITEKSIIFRKKKEYNNIKFPQGVSILFRQDKVLLPKIGYVICKYDRLFKGKITEVSVYKVRTGKYYIKVSVNVPQPVVDREGQSSIAITGGHNTMYALSNGNRISEPMNIRISRQKVEKLKRALRRKKNSNNRIKCKKKLLLAIEHLENQQRDYMQKITTKMIREYNHIITDRCDDKMLSMLRYKCMWYGVKLSCTEGCDICKYTCSTCGNVQKEKINLSWKCNHCDTIHNSNHNNATNIKNIAGRSTLSFVKKGI